MDGKLIVIEGLDGSGKATQAELLYKALCDRGTSVRKISFPDYDSASSSLVKMYLNGEFGSQPFDVNAYAASSFYAVDRYAGYKKNWGNFLQDGGIVIADRYTTSNAVHQCSKLPKDNWDEYLRWLFDYEYKYLGIPEPTLIFYLHVDPEVSQQLMSKRYKDDEQKKDIHERNMDYLKQSQAAASYCANKLGWNVVDCCREVTMRSIEEIHNDIMKNVLQRLDLT